jgi:hypothetical protein
LIIATLLHASLAMGQPAYPLLDGRCGEYATLNAPVIASQGPIEVRMFQDQDYVWLCYDLPADSYGTLDLSVDSPGLDEPLNLHVSAQLGEWRAEHPDEAPQKGDSELWWQIDGWWSNVVSFNGTKDTDEGRRTNFRPSTARELQLSKQRFGRGEWRLVFDIRAIRDDDGNMTTMRIPKEDSESMRLQIH